MDTTADAYLYAGVRMMASEETIKIVGVVVQAVSIAVTAYFASRGLSAWRHQLLGRRQVEVAAAPLVDPEPWRLWRGGRIAATPPG